MTVPARVIHSREKIHVLQAKNVLWYIGLAMVFIYLLFLKSLQIYVINWMRIMKGTVN